MSRLEWYRYLRSGWEPMAARLAWTQALLNEGTTIDEWEVRPQFDFNKIDRLVIANYAAGEWNKALNKPLPFWKMLMGKKK